MLLKDAEDALVIAELKVVQDDQMYMQALRYFDYIADNLALVARAYPKHGVAVSVQPRILLVAPEFGDDTLIAARWDYRVTLWKYQRLVFQDRSDDILLVNEVECKPQPEFVDLSPRTWDDLLSYCLDQELVNSTLAVLAVVET